MATITIRNLDPRVKESLRVQAAEHGHSMEAEARRILQDSLSRRERGAETSLAQRIHTRFAALGGVELDLPQRASPRDPPTFD